MPAGGNRQAAKRRRVVHKEAVSKVALLWRRPRSAPAVPAGAGPGASSAAATAPHLALDALQAAPSPAPLEARAHRPVHACACLRLNLGCISWGVPML